MARLEWKINVKECNGTEISSGEAGWCEIDTHIPCIQEYKLTQSLLEAMWQNIQYF